MTGLCAFGVRLLRGFRLGDCGGCSFRFSGRDEAEGRIASLRLIIGTLRGVGGGGVGGLNAHNKDLIRPI